MPGLLNEYRKQKEILKQKELSAKLNVKTNATLKTNINTKLNTNRQSAALTLVPKSTKKDKTPVLQIDKFKYRTLDLGSYKMFFTIENQKLIYKFI